MVDAGDKKSQKPTSAEDLAQAERYEAMLAAVTRNDEEDLDFEDDEEVDSAELAKQRQLLAAVAMQARRYQKLDIDEIEDPDEIMRQIYEENLLMGQDRGDAGAEPDELAQLQAESLAQADMDRLQALNLLKAKQ